MLSGGGSKVLSNWRSIYHPKPWDPLPDPSLVLNLHVKYLKPIVPNHVDTINIDNIYTLHLLRTQTLSHLPYSEIWAPNLLCLILSL